MQTIEQLIYYMAHDIRADIHGDISGHEYYAEEIINLRNQLAMARSIISETKEYLQDGGYLSQDTGLIWQCKQFLGEKD